jgi:hypothetical protein
MFKRMLGILTVLALTGVMVSVVAGLGWGIEGQKVGEEVLIDAVALENGDSVVISLDDQLWVLIITYVRVDGKSVRWLSEQLPNQRKPDRLIVEACGGFVQIHAGWEGENPVIMKYIWELAQSPGNGSETVYLPVVCTGKRVIELTDK